MWNGADFVVPAQLAVPALVVRERREHTCKTKTKLDSGHQANICAREMASVVSRGLPWPPALEIPRFQIQMLAATATTFRVLEFEFC